MQHISLIELRRQFSTYGAPFSVNLQRKYGDLFETTMPVLGASSFVRHPDQVHDLLVTQAGKIDKPKFLTRVMRSSFGNGLFSSGGDLWKKQRRLMQPTFHHGKIGRFASRIVDQAQQHQTGWHHGDVIDIGAEMHALTFKIATLLDLQRRPSPLPLGHAFR